MIAESTDAFIRFANNDAFKKVRHGYINLLADSGCLVAQKDGQTTAVVLSAFNDLPSCWT